MLKNLNPTKLVLGVLGVPIAAASAWLSAAAGKYGLHLDPSGINALAVAGATAGTALVVKLIHDVDKNDPWLALHAATVADQVGKIADDAVKVDPQLKTAADEAVTITEAKVEKTLADAWPVTITPTPAVAPTVPAPPASVAPVPASVVSPVVAIAPTA